MRKHVASVLVAASLSMPLVHRGQPSSSQDESYLSWDERRAVEIGRSFREDGRVGGIFDTRILSTNRSYNYKLRATWMTPEVIRASARLAQLREFLTDDQTRALVEEAESAGDTVILVEIDPREGSGVIPLDWIAVLRPSGTENDDSAWVRGESRPALRQMKALRGVAERDYDYDVFWVVFSLSSDDGRALFEASVRDAELVVRIYEKEGRVNWPIPASIRAKVRSLAGGLVPVPVRIRPQIAHR
jgi:hypothetical protein